MNIAIMTEDQRVQRLSALENKLIEITLRYAQPMQDAVKVILDPLEQKIYERAMPLYDPHKGRWWDSWGIPDTIPDAKYILGKECLEERLKLKAFAVLGFHDSGYPRLDTSEEYTKADIRTFHMEESAKNFMKAMAGFDAGNFRPFSSVEKEEIRVAIAKHDEHMLTREIEGESELLKVFMDLDAIWVPRLPNFIKDYVSRYARPAKEPQGMNMSPLEFLRMRQSYFFDMAEDFNHQQTVLITPQSNARFAKKKLPIHLEATKIVLAASMLARTSELETMEYAYVGDWTALQPLVKDYLEGSIEAARLGISYDMSRFGNQVASSPNLCEFSWVSTSAYEY